MYGTAKKPETAPGGPHRRRHGDERVGGVEIAAEQEPGGDRAEALAAQAPLVQRGEVLSAGASVRP